MRELGGHRGIYRELSTPLTPKPTYEAGIVFDLTVRGNHVGKVAVGNCSNRICSLMTIGVDIGF